MAKQHSYGWLILLSPRTVQTYIHTYIRTYVRTYIHAKIINIIDSLGFTAASSNDDAMHRDQILLGSPSRSSLRLVLRRANDELILIITLITLTSRALAGRHHDLSTERNAMSLQRISYAITQAKKPEGAIRRLFSSLLMLSVECLWSL